MPQAVVLELMGEKVPLYPGRYAHGLFFALLSQLDPELASRLHEAPQKPFTLASLSPQGQGVTLSPRGRSGVLLLRLTVLDEVLFSAFLQVLLEAAPKGIPLGDTSYRLSRVLATPEDHPLAGRLSWEALRAVSRRQQVTLHFISPTVFTTSKPGGRTRYTPLPDPRLILSSLLDKWQAHSPYPYTPKEEAALRELLGWDVEVAGFRNLRFHRLQAGKSFLPGFTGEVRLKALGGGLEVQEALGRLWALSFFSGVGAKTTYGLGLTNPL